MPGKPLKPCRHAGCAALTRDGYCKKHRRDAGKRIESAEWHWMYKTHEWQELRREQLLREPFCRDCAERGERVRATEVDHVKPHRGDWSLFLAKDNLQSLCHRSHSAKTMRELMQRRQMR